MFENSYSYYNPLLNGQQQGFSFNPIQKANGNYFYVNGVEGAKAFLITQPNTTAILFDSDSNDFFVKSTNMQGQATLKRFEYKEKSLNELKQVVEPNNVNTGEFVSRKEFEEFKAQIGTNKAIPSQKPVQANINTHKGEN